MPSQLPVPCLPGFVSLPPKPFFNHPALSPANSSVATALAIHLPPKKWKPKQISKYRSVNYGAELPDEAFCLPRYGRSLYIGAPRPLIPERDDIIPFSAELHSELLEKSLKVGENCPADVRDAIIDIHKRHWDAFDPSGVRRPILGFQYVIDTGDSPPVASRQPNYGIYERPIMLKFLEDLKHNGLIREENGPWASSLVLAPKPHQEDIDDIDEYIWRMCVNYRPLNAVTRPYLFPIPRCLDALEGFAEAQGPIWFMTLDAMQGFHQIAVDPQSQEKLAFWGPDGRKYTYTVLPFGPMNGPSVYSAIMTILREDWNKLAAERIPASVRYGDKNIIDDILLWSTDVTHLLTLLDCVASTFVKYRVSFKLKKCEYLQDRVEWLGHDLTPTGNLPAVSKFALIENWTLPTSAQQLHSNISFLSFYSRYLPWFEVKSSVLRRIRDQHKNKPIPAAFWDAHPDLAAAFYEAKASLLNSLELARIDPGQRFFLKTDWSNAGMGGILMQAASDDASQQALRDLEAGGDCTFDLTLRGPRLRPVKFISRCCDEKESHFHSFVGEAAAGRWAIGRFRQYLWGHKFYWLTDCSAIKAIHSYDGTHHQLSRWAQDLLAFDFEIFHRPSRMMRDVDAISRFFFEPSIAAYYAKAQSLHAASFAENPAAYTPIDLSQLPSSLCISSNPPSPTTIPSLLSLPLPASASFQPIDPQSDTISDQGNLPRPRSPSTRSM